LYENDCIFDKFECGISGDGNNFITGSYNSEFHIYDRYGRSDVCISPNPRSTNATRRHSLPHHMLTMQVPAAAESDVMDFSKKVLQTSWHPAQREVAVSIRNNLYVYSA
jgi:serine/threonine-protein phosphatase 2A regulatory subunit B